MSESKVDITGNPAPLGLLAFGMTTLLLNFHNAGFYAMDSMILAMGLFYGGLAQIILGIMGRKKGNTFGLTAFTSYGFFWLSLVGLIILPKMAPGIDAPATQPATAMALYLIVWGVFTLSLFLATLKMNRALQIVFGSLVVLFLFLAIGDATSSIVMKKLAGWVGIFCGCWAMYTGMAQVMNEVHGKTVWPLGNKRR